jgi:ABC-2 type transport system permease protein
VTALPTPAAGNAARILDQGYLPYDGTRRGVAGAFRAVVVQTMQQALGIRRGAWAKVFPILCAALAYLPAIAFVGISIFFKEQLQGEVVGGGAVPGAAVPGGVERILPSYGEYYGFVWGAILLFTAFVAPGVLCTDRRRGIFGLAIASPLNRTTYLLAKATGITSVLAIATLGPPLLMLVANVLNEQGPDGPMALAETLGRILVAGVLVTLLYVSFSMAVASTTTRWAAASTAIVVVFFAATVLATALVRGARLAPELFALDIVQLPFELVLRLFGDGNVARRVRPVSGGFLVACYVGWTVAFSAFAWWRYQRIRVTR